MVGRLLNRGVSQSRRGIAPPPTPRCPCIYVKRGRVSLKDILLLIWLKEKTWFRKLNFSLIHFG